MREWGESNHHGHSKKCPPADLKSVKPTGTHPLPDIPAQLYQVTSTFEKIIEIKAAVRIECYRYARIRKD